MIIYECVKYRTQIYMESLNDFIRTTKSLLHLYGHTTLHEQHTRHFVDPLSVIITIGLLNYKASGTKISIVDNFVKLDEKTLFQGSLRLLKGSKRNDLKIIHQAIIHACRYYLSNEYREILEFIFENAKQGLIKLRNTYKYCDETVQLLTIYINLIEKSLEGYDEIFKFLEHLIDLSECRDKNEKENNVYGIKRTLYNKFNNLWSIHRLNIISNFFIELDTNRDSDKVHIFESINGLLKNVHEDVISLIQNV